MVQSKWLRHKKKAPEGWPSMLKRCCVAFAALAVSCAIAGADYAPEQAPNNWPNNQPYNQKREWPAGPNREYLRNLQRPDNSKHPYRYRDPKSLSCCDAGDTVKTKFKVETGDGPYPEDRWYAWLNGEWVLVPPDKIVPDHAPDGTPYLFMMAGTIQCFVRPRGGL
jgi:hypothetical protein